MTYLRKRYMSFLFAMIAVFSSHAIAQNVPLTLDNCGQKLTFDKTPESTITIGQAVTEAMYLLGLSDKVKATAVWFTDVLPEYEEANAQIRRLASSTPSFEAIVNKHPDLVMSQYEWYIGSKGSIGTREQFHDLGVPTYIWPADCIDKDNSVGSDGMRQKLISTEVIYRGLTELSQIFGVEEAGQKAVADLKAREMMAVKRARALDLKGVSALFWFSSARMDADPYVAGSKGVPGFIMGQLGIRNVVESNEEWPTVGWETLAKANPTYIVLADLQRRTFPADAVDVKMDFLKNDPVASQIDAVKEGRIVVLDAHAMDATIRMISGLELMTDAMEKEATQ